MSRGSSPTCARAAHPLSPLVARKLLQRDRHPALVSKGARNATANEASGLTPRELAALDLIARGYTYGEIAELLTVSVHTVQTHIKHIYAKLSVHTRGEAVFEAHKLGLLKTSLLSPDQH